MESDPVPLAKKSRNPADKEQFQWKCCANKPESREVLEKELPEIFNYKIDRFKLLETRREPHENKFEAEFIVDVCTEEDRDAFISHLEAKTGTNFNKAWTERKGKAGWIQRTLKCARNVKLQLSENEEGGGKGSGSGRVKGVERQPGKNQDCKTTMSTRLYPCNKDHNNEDIDKCYNLQVELVYHHTYT